MNLTIDQKKEIEEQKLQNNKTKRAVSPELEKILYCTFSLIKKSMYCLSFLSHDFVKVKTVLDSN